MARPGGAPTFVEPLRAVRLGLLLITGAWEGAALRLMVVRAAAPIERVAKVAMRAQLDAHDLRCMSGVDALVSLRASSRCSLESDRCGHPTYRDAAPGMNRLETSRFQAGGGGCRRCGGLCGSTSDSIRWR